MNLTPLPVSAISSRSDHFHCSVYDATITAGCCSSRQAKARKAIGGDSTRLCIDCPLGREVELRSGGPVAVPKHSGKEEASRKRGGVNGLGALKRWRARREDR